MPTTDKKITKNKKFTGFSDFERSAMRERAQELAGGDGESVLLAKIAEMTDSDRALAEKLHKLITTSAPSLTPKTWYGMPAYANADGKVVCFFQPADKFKARYATLGFNDPAHLDEGDMWATSYAVKELTPAVKAEIAELVKKAIG